MPVQIAAVPGVAGQARRLGTRARVVAAARIRRALCGRRASRARLRAPAPTAAAGRGAGRHSHQRTEDARPRRMGAAARLRRALAPARLRRSPAVHGPTAAALRAPLLGRRRQLAEASPTMCGRCAAMRSRFIRCGTPSISNASRRPALGSISMPLSGLPAADGVAARRARRDVRALEGTRDVSERARDAAVVRCRCAATSSAARCTRRRAVRCRSPSCARWCRRSGLESRVGFTGFVQDSATAMRALDIVVHASTDPEPFGLVIAEAMACGKPVVASRAGGAVGADRARRQRARLRAW